MLVSNSAVAQTCCSGGVPVSSNLGLPLAVSGTFQFSISYDLNTLQTLKSGSATLNDNTRNRRTNSAIVEVGYSVSNRLSFDIFTSFVRQSRTISVNGFSDKDVTNGFGDLVLLAKYQLVNSPKVSLTIGTGPKIPTGASDKTDDQGLSLIADLQPGSGARDWIIWGQLSRPVKWRPSLSTTLSFVHSIKGKNENYLNVQSYQFGNDTQLSLAITDQFLLGKMIIEPAIQVRYRNAEKDEIDSFILPNTGGQWLFISPGCSIPFTPKIKSSLTLDLPLKAKVIGTQLSPTTRWNLGLSWQFSKTNNPITL